MVIDNLGLVANGKKNEPDEDLGSHGFCVV
jgi:hypothetical protein